jgi:RNA recognition motif-containing protein
LGAGQSAREVTVASSRIQVTNFDKSTTEEELKELFSVYGRVRQVEIVSVRGLGFVEMFKKSEAKKAALALDGSEFKGATLKVQEARRFHDSDRRRNRRR